jgi:REP element-mobilizing transposase RayT
LERRYIFESAMDKKEFLARFGDNLLKVNAQCLAWALMFNHYHFLIRVGVQPLSRLMAPVLGGYAGYYNRRHRRSGYVFQNRFSSILCCEDSYLLELVRYIHLNPLRAKMVESVKELGKYPWTGHAGVLGRYQQQWHGVNEVLTHFGERRTQARKKYLEFVQAGVDGSRKTTLSGGGLVRSYGGWESVQFLRREHILCVGDERILGESNFVEQVLNEDELSVESKSRLHHEGWTLDRLIAWVCEHCDVQPPELYKRSRENPASKAKALICYLGVEKLGLTSAEIARHLKVSRPAISKWLSKGRALSRFENGLETFD